MSRSLPPQLLQSLHGVSGFDEQSFVEVHQERKEVVSVRFNPLKYQNNHQQLFPGSFKVPWSSLGYYLAERPSFTLDPLLHAGVYYVQEASGMFIEHCLRQLADTTLPVKVLDLCAAPGGKSTLLRSIISADSLLVSNEVIKGRVNILAENMIKWGAPNVIVTNNDPKHFARMPGFFDIMLVDAPCSGSGLFRRDPEAMNEWSVEAVEMCSLRQQRIVTDALPCLNKGGLLIYSTCSYSREENENICDWMLDNFNLENVAVDIAPEWNIIATESDKHHAVGYRFFPDKIAGEGLFVACFRKNDGTEEKLSLKKERLVSASKGDRLIAADWVEQHHKYRMFELQSQIFAFPDLLAEYLQVMHQNMYIKNAGVVLGKVMKNALVPDHQLALSSIVNKNLASIVLKKAEALQYLRKEEVTVNTNTKGWALAQFENQNIGWVKVLDNRINNYYPKEWRILKSGNN